MHAIKLMLINYLTKFYNSELCVKVICTSYDIPKNRKLCRNILFPKMEIRKEKEPVARGAPSDRSLVSSAPLFRESLRQPGRPLRRSWSL
jgi:hypothetical protein